MAAATNAAAGMTSTPSRGLGAGEEIVASVPRLKREVQPYEAYGEHYSFKIGSCSRFIHSLRQAAVDIGTGTHRFASSYAKPNLIADDGQTPSVCSPLPVRVRETKYETHAV